MGVLAELFVTAIEIHTRSTETGERERAVFITNEWIRVEVKHGKSKCEKAL